MQFTPNTVTPLEFEEKALARHLEGEAEFTSTGAVKFHLHEIGGPKNVVLWIHPNDSPAYTLLQVRYALEDFFSVVFCRCLARELFNLARAHIGTLRSRAEGLYGPAPAE